MYLTHVQLKNWRNFKQTAPVNLRDKVYLLGANAVGKSNFLDVFRFLRDITKESGGGIQRAVSERGGMKMLRCLHARNDSEVSIEVGLSESLDAPEKWRYHLAFKGEGKDSQRVLVTAEQVLLHGQSRPVLSRPDAGDKRDPERLTQTHIEQINTNTNFREVATFFQSVTYLHLVPQLLKYGNRIGGHQLEDDPFGQGFLDKVACAPERVRNSRLKKIQKVLAHAIPQFSDLKFELDKGGKPHLLGRYEHYRPHAGWTREEHFSDGTLRLISLLWLLLDGESLLLLEEPELSLDDKIVSQIPNLLHKAEMAGKRKPRQTFISTHSYALLNNESIDARGILWLKPTSEGTEIRTPSEHELAQIRAGLTPADVFLPKVAARLNDQQLSFI